MNALISPNEKVFDENNNIIGQRVAQVGNTTFPIAPPLFWMPCANDVVADQYYYDPDTQQIIKKPEPNNGP